MTTVKVTSDRAATDVTITWRKYGWVPKGEQK